MRSARKVHACMNFLRIDKKPKRYQMPLAEMLSMVASGETPEKSPQQRRDTHHTLQSQLLVLETTGSSPQHGQCPRSTSCCLRLPVAATLISIAIRLKLHLLLLSLSFLLYILLTSSVHMYLSTFRSLGDLCFSSMVNTELCSSPLRIPC